MPPNEFSERLSSSNIQVDGRSAPAPEAGRRERSFRASGLPATMNTPVAVDPPHPSVRPPPLRVPWRDAGSHPSEYFHIPDDDCNCADHMLPSSLFTFFDHFLARSISSTQPGFCKWMPSPAPADLRAHPGSPVASGMMASPPTPTGRPSAAAFPRPFARPSRRGRIPPHGSDAPARLRFRLDPPPMRRGGGCLGLTSQPHSLGWKQL